MNTIDREYGSIKYEHLQDIRVNMACRYHCGRDKDGQLFPLHVLDSVMENVNMYTKQLLMSADERSWERHSPNVMFARRAIHFEQEEGMRNIQKHMKIEHTRLPKNTSRRGMDILLCRIALAYSKQDDWTTTIRCIRTRQQDCGSVRTQLRAVIYQHGI